MSNKNDKSVKFNVDSENSQKVQAKGRVRFNIIDLFLILVVILTVTALVAYFLPGITDRFSSGGEVEITYVLEFRGVDDMFIANIQNGDNAYDARQNFSMGVVKTVATESYETLEYDVDTGSAVMREHPEKKTLIITVTTSAIYTDGEGYSINGERIAVGGKYDMRFPNFTGTAYCTQIKLSSN